ncbi:hypothetical protein GCM10023193_42760 [Planotetraspora kaengkrachanensis]|uniref:Uncharacterized protein n=1 Tax=Planotetraspora kaengkrachanensis TaxID=575193 RepID=A0A8J3M124_9ACTN|nr:hypothetical protein Pka01_35470 [Planotetraspora kaengkrachanensis]
MTVVEDGEHLGLAPGPFDHLGVGRGLPRRGGRVRLSYHPVSDFSCEARTRFTGYHPDGPGPFPTGSAPAAVAWRNGGATAPGTRMGAVRVHRAATDLEEVSPLTRQVPRVVR